MINYYSEKKVFTCCTKESESLPKTIKKFRHYYLVVLIVMGW